MGLVVVMWVVGGRHCALQPLAASRRRAAMAVALALAAISASAGPAMADDSAAEAPATAVRWDADLRLRGGQFWEDRAPAPGTALGSTGDARRGGMHRTRLGVSLERDFLRGRVQVQADGTSGELSSTAVSMQEAWAELRRGERTQFRLRGGRQRLRFGNGLLVGEYDLSNRGRVFDAVEATLQHSSVLTLQAIGGRAQQAEPDDTLRRLLGLSLHALPHASFAVDVHLLGHGDELGPQRWRMLTLGAGVQWQATERVALAASGALQAGDVRTEGQKTGSDQLAGMGRVEATVRGRSARPWQATLQATIWSGDTEPADQVQRAFRPLFGDLDDAVGWLRLWRPSGLRQAVLRGVWPVTDRATVDAEWRVSQAVGADAAPWWRSDRSWQFAGHEPVLRFRYLVASHSAVQFTAGNWLPSLPARPDASQVWLEWRSQF